MSYKNLSAIFRAFALRLSCMEIPHTVWGCPEVHEWKKVVFKGMKTLEKNGTRELVDLPRGKTIVGYK